MSYIHAILVERQPWNGGLDFQSRDRKGANGHQAGNNGRERVSRRRSRRSDTRRAIVGATLCLGTVGCAKVDPRADFDRAAKMISARTGVDRVYTPERSSADKEAVTALLANGLTVDEAVQVALLNNKRFQALVEDIGVARANVVQSGLLSNPSIGFSPRFPDGGGRSNLTVTFAQQIADLWQIPVRKRIAEAALERSILNIANEANRLTFEVKRDCYTLISLERLKVVASETLGLAEKSFKLARDRFKAGVTSKVDVNLARAGVLNGRSRIMALEREAQVARTTLAHALGLARWRQPWTLEDSLPTDTLAFEDQESLLVFAMKERLDARAAAMKVQAARDEIKRQTLRVFPNVTLGVELERPERRSLPGRNVLADTARSSVAGGRLTAPSIQSRGQRRLERRQVIDSLLGPTLDMTLPIWDQNQAKIARARFLAAKARKDFEGILDRVASDIRQAHTIATSAAELVKFFEDEALPHARESVETARRAYKAGNVDILALLDAQKTLVAQQESDVGAKRDLAIAVAQLRRATGGRLPWETGDDSPSEQPSNSAPTPETP